MLCHRYRDAGQDAPVILYTDRDCCNRSNPSKFLELFDEWCQLQVSFNGFNVNVTFYSTGST